MGGIDFYIPASIFIIIATNLIIVAVIVFIFHKLFRKLLPFTTKPLLEKRISDILPFYSIDNYIVKMKNGDYSSVIELDGVDYSTLTQGDIEGIAYSRFIFYKDLGIEGGKIKFFISKSKIETEIELKESKVHFLNDLFSAVNQNLGNSFETKYYIFCYGKNNEELEVITSKIESIFTRFNPKVLIEKDLLHFLWFLVNHNRYKELDCSYDQTHYLVSNSEHSFDGSLITIKNTKETLYSNIFSINFFSHEVNSGFINELLALNFKIEAVINAKVFENNVASYNLDIWRRMGTVLPNRTRDAQFYEVQELVQSTQESLIEVQVSFYIYGESEEDLARNKKIFLKIVHSRGMNLLQENKGSEIMYFNRFLGFEYILRPRPITSSNLTHFIDFRGTDKGLSGCDWGKYPLAYFKSFDGSAYKLFLHVNDNEGETSVAHTVSFAPTGSGKTFLFQHLIAGALYFYDDVKVYCFDRLKGMKVFTQSSGGIYLELKSASVEFNPLLLDLEDEENRIFLAKWLEMTSECSDDDSLKLIDKSIKVLAKLPIKDRKLSFCIDLLLPKDSNVYRALEKFARGVHKDLFNGEKDSISLENGRFITFDMTEILEDEKVSASLLSYIMYKIRKYAKENNTPHLVFIDETSAMLKNKVFAKYIEVMLKEHRKYRGSINVVFQDVSDIIKLGVAEIILNQCQTRFIFKNVDAKDSIYQETLDLNDNQMDMVKGMGVAQHVRRPLIVQKQGRVSLLDIDLKGLGKLTKFYDSSIDAVTFLSQLMENEDNWYEIYKHTSVKEVVRFRGELLAGLEDGENRNISIYNAYKNGKENGKWL